MKSITNEEVVFDVGRLYAHLQKFSTIHEPSSPVAENGDALEIQAMLQRILEPIQSQTKETFIHAFVAVHQRSRIIGNHL